MPTLMDSTAVRTKPASWIAVGFAVVLGLAIVGIPNLMRSRMSANESWRFARERGLGGTPASNSRYGLAMKAVPATPSVSTALTRHSKYDEARANASTERKMVRRSSVDLVVQKPAEVAERIRALAESMGGFLVSSEVSGALFRGTASLTIRGAEARIDLSALRAAEAQFFRGTACCRGAKF